MIRIHQRLSAATARASKLAAVVAFAFTACLTLCVTAERTAAPAVAKDEPLKGILLVRRGAANTTANYAKEDRDPNGKLMDVSVQCDPNVKPPATPAKLAGLTAGQAGFGAAPMSANSTVFINAGAKVRRTPQRGNALHCSIDSLPLSLAVGTFR